MSRRPGAIHYFDSSVLLRYSIGHVEALRDLSRYASNAYSSVISRVECLRVIDRWRLTREVSDERLVEVRSACLKLLGGLRLVDIDAGIIEIASQTFPIALKSLDAVHLATVMRLKLQMTADVVVLTHDQKLALAATALGLDVVGTSA